jgi:hypothetical protein
LQTDGQNSQVHDYGLKTPNGCDRDDPRDQSVHDRCEDDRVRNA